MKTFISTSEIMGGPIRLLWFILGFIIPLIIAIIAIICFKYHIGNDVFLPIIAIILAFSFVAFLLFFLTLFSTFLAPWYSKAMRKNIFICGPQSELNKTHIAYAKLKQLVKSNEKALEEALEEEKRAADRESGMESEGWRLIAEGYKKEEDEIWTKIVEHEKTIWKLRRTIDIGKNLILPLTRMQYAQAFIRGGIYKDTE